MEIDLLNYIDDSNILLDFKAKNKKAIIAAILNHLIDVKKIAKENKRTILKAIIQREEIGSTAIGGAISLPHARLTCIKELVLSVAISPQGVDFESLDQEPVNVVVLLLSNQNEAGLHLKTLAHLAKLLRDKFFIQQLKNAKTTSDVIHLIKRQQDSIR